MATKTVTAGQQGHTPGPWRTGDRFQTVFGPANGDPCPAQIACMGSVNYEANARLIAAAPEMLAALEAARNYIRDLRELCASNRALLRPLSKDVLVGKTPPQLQIEAAIQKAKGGL